ncbi:MAG: type II secretion system F family protein [Actinomycetes bacterium]
MPAASHAKEVAELSATLATELRSGQQPDAAWSHAVGRPTAALPGLALPDADVVLVLTRWSRQPGWGGLRAIAICWQLADSSGAGLADALDRIGDAMRHEHEIALEVHGQLATTRATAVLLATLPLMALLMASLLGADLVGVLLGTWLGLSCLAAGIVLTTLGCWWVMVQVVSVRRVLQW